MDRSAGATAVIDSRHVADFELFSPELRHCPYPFYEHLRVAEPVFRVPGEPGDQEVYLISRWEDVVTVAQDTETFSSCPFEHERGAMPPADWSGPTPEPPFSHKGLARCDGADHKPKRNVLLKFVSRDRLRTYTPLIEEMTNALIDGFIDRGQVDLASEFSGLLPLHVICMIFGLSPEHREYYFRVGSREPNPSLRYMSETKTAQQRAVESESSEFMRRVLVDRYENPGDDFLSEFVHAHVKGTGMFYLPHLIADANSVLYGGLVTTQHMITNTMMLLLENPDQMRRVQGDHSLIRTMLDESLRLESPFRWEERRVRKDTELSGVKIPAGSVVVMNFAAGNRDEDKFENAEAFEIDRSGVTKNQLAFGRGNHMCVGAPLARLEGEIAFKALLSRLRNIRLAPGKNDFAQIDSISFRSPKALHLEFEKA